MKQAFVKTDFSIQAFSIKRLLFDDSDLVSLDVRCRIGEELRDTTLLFTFARFNDLLRFSGETGEKLQLLVSDKLWSGEEKPYIIESGNEALIFTTCNLELAYLIDEDMSCLSVEDINPISFLQQARNLRTNIRDFQQAHIHSSLQLNQALQEIATQYRYYLGLKELNLNEEAARAKAGLSNEKLFKIAYHAAVQSK